MTEKEIHERLMEWRDRMVDRDVGGILRSELNDLYRTLVAVLCPAIEAEARAKLEEACRKRMSA